ncbi:MAG: Gfo/Idh/MocA family oxidoreductase [Myxococcota bacterium]
MGDTLRYGIIGSGMMGTEHMRNIAVVDGADVVAYADPHEPSRGFGALTCPDARGYSDYRDLLDDADVDAVIVATPNHTHRAVLEDLFATGKHILCEKPMCTSVEDARWVADRAEAYGGVFWCGMEYRYMAPVARLVAAVHDGAVGTLRMLAIREHRFPFLPKVDDWNRFERNTGGTLVEKCCHYFDLMRLITQSEAVRVYASGAQDVNHLDERYAGEQPDILDNAFVVVDFASGTRALLDLCMFAEGSRNQEEIAATGDAGKVESFVPSSDFVEGRRRGEDGLPAVRVENVPVDPIALEAGFHHGATYYAHQAFGRAVRGESEVEVTAHDGLRAVEIGAAAEASVRSGQPVAL